MDGSSRQLHPNNRAYSTSRLAESSQDGEQRRTPGGDEVMALRRELARAHEMIATLQERESVLRARQA